MNRTAEVGFRSAVALLAVGVAYLVVVAVGVARVGTAEPIVDPVLAVMEVLTLVSAPLVVLLLSAVHGYAPPPARVWTRAGLGFGIVMAGLTTAVHFASLTAGRQTGPVVLAWPSAAYAVELLAWDVFLGLALICAATAFPGGGLHASARRGLWITGALCLAGTVGPVVGDMALQRIGIAGYGLGLPVCCILLARVFREAAARDVRQSRRSSRD